MSSTKEQVMAFIEKCEEIKRCKFIMATTRIKDLLKCIVNSPELYKLFDTVTKDFNYIEFKSKCLVTTDDGFIRKSSVVLPQTVGQRLAFIFCLLVEVDRDTLNFNDFLQQYFAEDGSYFASYQTFCKVFITGLEDLIKQVFKEQLKEEEYLEANRGSVNAVCSKLVSTLTLYIESEKQFISQCSIPKEEKENATKILSMLHYAVKEGNEQLIDALVCGYNYFVLYNKCVSNEIASLIQTLAEYEDCL